MLVAEPKPKVQSFLYPLLIPLKFLSSLGPQVEGRRITIEVQSSKDVASVTVDGTKVCRLYMNNSSLIYF